MAGEPEKDGSCGCNSSFECNICLDVAKEPVVTICGHLFCWPCLYRWLYAQAPFTECPVCKGEVQRWHITPIYGRGSEEGDSSANPGLPPRPRAHRRESLSQQLQMEDLTELGSQIRQLIQNHGTEGGLPHPTPALNEGNVASESSNQNQLPHFSGDSAAQVVPAAPQQPSSVEQLSTSSTAAAMAGEPGPSRQSRRPSESPTIRRTRRRRPQ